MTDFASLVMKVDSRQMRAGRGEMDQFGKSADTMSGKATKGFNAVQVAAAAAVAVLASLGAAIGTIREFESSMSRLAAITGATTSELASMRDVARDLGATTEFSAKQAADGLTFLGMAGFSAAESMAAIPAVLDLATAAGLDLASAADTASNIMSGFGIAAADSAQVADILAAASSRANTDVGQLGQAMSTVAPISAALGIDLADTAAAIGVLSDAGIQGARAGTAMRGVLASLAGPTNEAETVLKKLGLTIADVNPETNDLSDVMGKLGAAGLTTAQAMTLFGREAASGALVLVEGAGRLREFGVELGNVDGAAADMANTMRDNLGGDIDGLMSALSGLMIALGDAGLTAILRGVVYGLTAVTRAVSDAVAAFGFVAESVGSALAVLSGFGAANRELQSISDTTNLAIAGEVAQVDALTLALTGGRTYSREVAEVKLLQAQAHLAAADAIRQENIEAVKNSSAYGDLVTRIGEAQADLATAMKDAADQESLAMQGRMNTAGFAAAEVSRIAEELRAAVVQQHALVDAAGTLGPEHIAATNAVDELRAALEAATGRTVNLGGEIQGAADTADALARLAGGINFDTASASARTLAAELGIALSTATRIALMSDSSRAGVSGPDGAIASLQGEGRLGGGPLQGIVSTLNVGPRFNPTSGGGSSGGGGGASEAQRAAEKAQNDNLRERDRILSSLMTAQDEYNAGLEQANRLLAADVLTDGVYAQHVAQLRQELTDTEWADSGLKPFIDDLSQAGLSMESLGDVFENQIARMAQSWLSSGLTSIGQSFMGIGGGGGASSGIISSLLGSIPSFNGGGSTGNGPRSGGLDGMGGFLAVNHPQETIIDHSKGQSGGGSQNVHVTVGVSADSNGNLLPFVASVTQAGIQQNNKRMATARGRPT